MKFLITASVFLVLLGASTVVSHHWPELDWFNGWTTGFLWFGLAYPVIQSVK